MDHISEIIARALARLMLLGVMLRGGFGGRTSVTPLLVAQELVGVIVTRRPHRPVIPDLLVDLGARQVRDGYAFHIYTVPLDHIVVLEVAPFEAGENQLELLLTMCLTPEALVDLLADHLSDVLVGVPTPELRAVLVRKRSTVIVANRVGDPTRDQAVPRFRETVGVAR